MSFEGIPPPNHTNHWLEAQRVVRGNGTNEPLELPGEEEQETQTDIYLLMAKGCDSNFTVRGRYNWALCMWFSLAPPYIRAVELRSPKRQKQSQTP